jgi:hypothetical protein
VLTAKREQTSVALFKTKNETVGVTSKPCLGRLG